MENDFAGVPRDAGEILAVTNIFGKYELGRLLGCGAFAKVYHAKNVRTGQSVAIKSISKQRLAKGNLVAHVKREIYIMRRMRHPHIVKLFEVLATRTKVYFVMEFAKGGELFAKVAKGRFSEDLSRRYFQQLISAVRYCHARGVFHRDLKPENLLLDENWELKVSDFGLSAVAEQIGPDGMLHTLCGTPAYVAPEVLAKKGYDGSKVDVWSCGVVLYVLNVGYLPFNDTNLMVMYRKIYKGEFRCPRWLSPDLKRLLSRLLDTSPDTRITIDEITRDPWFRNGHGEIKPLVLNLAEDFDFKEKNINSDGANHMNAFDLISLSPSLNLSRLFGETDIPENSERFLSTETPERIIEKVREVADSEEVKMTTNSNRGIKLEGENGNFIFLLEIYRLMDNLVVVEVKKWAYEVGSCRGIWKDKLWPQLSGLIYQPDASVTGS